MIFPGKSLFSAPKPLQQDLPPVLPPAVAPVPDNKKAKAAARRKNAVRRNRSGRLSTIHTNADTTSTLGG